MDTLPEWYWLLLGFGIGWMVHAIILQLAYKLGIVLYIGKKTK